MTYTQAVLLAVPTAALLDLVVLRTRLLLTRRWWAAYAIVLFFQLVTNAWLTGRGIVRYAPEAIVGGPEVVALGSGRLAWAPVEDLGFGFALVLLTLVAWTRAGSRAGRR